MINSKYALISVIEDRMNIVLTNEQLDYIFSENQKLLMTTIRRYGKDFITAIKIATHLILKNDYKIGVFCFGEYVAKEMIKKIKIILEILDAHDLIESCNTNPYKITVCNNSVLFITSSTQDCRGYAFDEAYIIEFFYKQGINGIINEVLATLVYNNNYKLNIIGTPLESVPIDNILNMSDLKHIKVDDIIYY